MSVKEQDNKYAIDVAEVTKADHQISIHAPREGCDDC